MILNYTYYPNNVTRYVVTNIYPGEEFSLKGPTTFNVTSVKQYLVTIDNASSWYDQGTQIRLMADVHFYEVGEFVGTLKASPNTVITVDRPLAERLQLSPNYPVIGGIVTSIVVSVLIMGVMSKGGGGRKR